MKYAAAETQERTGSRTIGFRSDRVAQGKLALVVLFYRGGVARRQPHAWTCDQLCAEDCVYGCNPGSLLAGSRLSLSMDV